MVGTAVSNARKDGSVCRCPTERSRGAVQHAQEFCRHFSKMLEAFAVSERCQMQASVSVGVSPINSPHPSDQRAAMKPLTASIILASLMASASVAGFVGRPSTKVIQVGPRFVLEETVPHQFGDWHELAERGARVVDPGTKQLLDKLYSQMLTRTYANSQGYQVMLSLAYGDDQRGGLAAHKPEICYPAQGFALLGLTEIQLTTPFGEVAAKRLETSLGTRKEPVTYWFTVGDTAIKNKVQQRLVEIKLSLTGQVPDGLLFRVSSIDEYTPRAFAAHDQFIADLLAAVPVEGRKRLSGLGNKSAGG